MLHGLLALRVEQDANKLRLMKTALDEDKLDKVAAAPAQNGDTTHI